MVAPAEVGLPVWGAEESMASRTDGVINTLTGLGSVNDKGQAGRPSIDTSRLNDSELTALYFDNGISTRIVDLVPNEMTRKGWTVTISDDDDDEADPEIDATSEEDERLQTLVRFNEGLKMARLYGGSVAVMVTTDDIPAEFLASGKKPSDWLAEPLDLDRVISLDALHVFDSYEAWPISFQGDMREPGYRDPLIWSISPTTPFTERSSTIGRTRQQIGMSSRVHASRVLFFRGHKRPPSWRHQGSSSNNRALDDSVLQPIWNEIRNLTSVMQGGATLAQELRESVIKVAGMKGIATSDQATAFQTRMKLIAMAKSLLGLIVLGEGDSYENRSNPPTGFKELSSEAQVMLSAVTGYPQTVLFGTVPAGLGKDDVAGRQQWDRLIASGHASIKPHLRQYYTVMFAAKAGPTEGAIPTTIKPVFLPLDEPSPKQIAEVRKINADSDAIYLDRHVVDPEAVAEARFGPRGYQQDIVIPEEEVEEEPNEEAKAEAAGELSDDAKNAAATAAGADVQKSAFNGSQTASLEAMMTASASGTLPKANVVAALVAAFPLTKKEAETIVPEPMLKPAAETE